MSTPTVTAQDQILINQFRNLHDNQQDLLSNIKQLKNKTDDLKDASEELEATFSDTFYLCLGTNSLKFFVQVEEDEAVEFCETTLKETKDQSSKASKQLNKLVKESSGIKAKLYSKFGDRIQLET